MKFILIMRLNRWLRKQERAEALVDRLAVKIKGAFQQLRELDREPGFDDEATRRMK